MNPTDVVLFSGDHMDTAVVALGGNAIKKAEERGTCEEQFKNVETACRAVMMLIDQGYRVVITHGNGPQSGNLMVQQEAAKEKVPAMPMEIVGAMTQGQIGYMIQQSLHNMRAAEENAVPVATIITQVLVSKDDPNFEDPSKPVGEFFTRKEVATLVKEGYVLNPPPGSLYKEKKMTGYVIKKVRPNAENGFRRVVPSPDPLKIVEAEAIKILIDAGVIVIASGGGGVPVVDNDGSLTGLQGVIDKDKAGERLAEEIGADTLLFLTDVESVYLNFGEENQRSIGKMTVKEAKTYLKEGHFLAGSMEPKITASIRFIEAGGKRAIITSLKKVEDALKGNAGTIVVP